MKKIFLTLTLILFVIPFGISQDLPSYVPADGLVAFYPFNGNANDASGNGYHGTRFQVGDGLDRHGNQNQSLYFNGKTADGTNNQQIINDSYVKVDNFDYSFSTSSRENQISISFWVKNEWNNQINPNDGLPILSRRTNNNIDFDLSLSGSNYNPSNAPALHLGFWSESSAQSVPDNSWAHCVVTCDGSNVKYYMQNQLYAEFSHNNGVILNNTSNLMIGKFSYQGALLHHFFFNGWIDDLGIWNKALTVEEISSLYNGSTSGGEILLNGVVSAENNQIKNVADPTHTQDAATKGYVDSNVNSFSGSYNDLTDTPTSSNAFQLPLVTTDQRDEITPQSGMMVYNIDVHEFQGFQNYEKIHPAEIDQQHVTINNGGGENRAQSFTAGVTGQLELVKLPLNVMMEPVELLFKIIEGEGVDGNVLFETSYNLTNSDQNWIEFSISGVDVISGNKYTIQIIENSGCGMPPCYNWGMDTSGDNYIGGQFFYNGTPYSNGDYDSAFITYVSLREAVNEWRTLH